MRGELGEPVEDVVVQFVGDALAVVDDRQPHLIAVEHRDDIDGAARCRTDVELERFYRQGTIIEKGENNIK